MLKCCLQKSALRKHKVPLKYLLMQYVLNECHIMLLGLFIPYSGAQCHELVVVRMPICLVNILPQGGAVEVQ